MLVLVLVLVLLSVATAIWHWARGEPAGPYGFGTFTGEPIVVGVGHYLGHLRRGGGGSQLS
jgi:hypothetical protein